MMNILCSTDNNYVPHCGIMLQSLFDNNQRHGLDVYILTNGLTTENELKLTNLPNSDKHKIHIVDVDDSLLSECPIREGNHVSLATYYRILTPSLLPKSVDKLLYLDVDMIVNGDVGELYDCEIGDYAIAAVVDEDCYNSLDRFDRLSYHHSMLYVNAGVLLINLEYWRANDIMNECLEYIAKYPDKCLFHDQDALNYVLRERKKLLPLKYNFQTGFLYTGKLFDKDVLGDIHKTIRDKSYVVMHYTGYGKPWHEKSRHPYRDLYYEYKSKSVFADEPLVICDEKNHLYWQLKRSLYNICAWLGLVEPVHTYIVEDGKLRNK